MSKDQTYSIVSEKTEEELRPTAKFPPNIWGDYFINYDYHKDTAHHSDRLEEINALKEEVRQELLTVVDHGSTKQRLEFIDTIERLGLGYYFESEIQQLLQHLYTSFEDESPQYDLYTLALCFRFLRQHAYFVSTDPFKKFTNEKGEFEESLAMASDAEGMLSLYEAANVGIPGEDILDDAIAFTTNHLQSMVDNLANPMAAKIVQSLHKPLHKRVPRVEARRYISIYQDDPSHNPSILKLAKLDFNLLQSLYKKELSELCRWKNDTCPNEKLPFARDRIVEGYFLILGLAYQPQYSFSRILLAKATHILSVMDDLYDAYGTFEELVIFTEATERWDESYLGQLPEHMQIVYKLFLDFSKEVEHHMTEKGWPLYRVDYAKEVIKMEVRASFEEAKWAKEKRVPTMEEYLQSTLVTAAVGTFTIIFLITMDHDSVDRQILDWVLSRPTNITTSEFHFRFLNDIKSYKFEQERGHTASSVDIYMKQYGLSEEETYEKMKKEVDKAWKDANEEFLKHTLKLPKHMGLFILNYPRVIHLMFHKGDGYTFVGEDMKYHIKSLFIDPILIS